MTLRYNSGDNVFLSDVSNTFFWEYVHMIRVRGQNVRIKYIISADIKWIKIEKYSLRYYWYDKPFIFWNVAETSWSDVFLSFISHEVIMNIWYSFQDFSGLSLEHFTLCFINVLLKSYESFLFYILYSYRWVSSTTIILQILSNLHF